MSDIKKNKNHFIKRTAVTVSCLALAAVCSTVIASKSKSASVKAKAGTDEIVTYIGENQTVSLKKEISSIKSGQKYAVCGESGSSVNIYPVRAGSEDIDVVFKDKSERKLHLKVEESPIKGEIVSLVNTSDKNSIAGIKITNDSDKMFEDVSVAYDIEVKKGGTTRQLGEDGTKYDMLRPHETRYIAAPFDAMKSGETLDTAKSTVTIGNMTSVSDKYHIENITDNVDMKVKGVSGKIKDAVLTPELDVDNRSSSTADVVSTIVFYDKNGNIIEVYDSGDTVFEPKKEDTYQYEYFVNSPDMVDTAKVYNQAFQSYSEKQEQVDEAEKLK